LHDEKDDTDNGDENEPEDEDDQLSGLFDDYQRDNEKMIAAEGQYWKRQGINNDSIDAMRKSAVDESLYYLKAFPLFNALRTYKLKGNPINLIGYINKIAKNELVHHATKKNGAFSTEGYYREMFGKSKRTIQRARKAIKNRSNPDEKGQEIDDGEILNIIENNPLKKKHRRDGYLTQNQLCSLVIYYLKQKDIKYSETTIRNIVSRLRKSNLIKANKEGSSYFFNNDKTDLRKTLEMIEKEIMEKKIKSTPPE